jgi:hypothetical protein
MPADPVPTAESVPTPPRVFSVELPSFDDELNAIYVVDAALFPLSDEAKLRVLYWATARAEKGDGDG